MADKPGGSVNTAGQENKFEHLKDDEELGPDNSLPVLVAVVIGILSLLLIFILFRRKRLGRGKSSIHFSRMALTIVGRRIDLWAERLREDYAGGAACGGEGC